MSSTFGAPIPSGTPSDPGQAAAAAFPSDAPQDILDPNDPALVSEDISMDTEKDAYAQPAPPPDGKYRAKLKLAKKKDAKGQEVDYVPALWGQGSRAQKVWVMGIEMSIQDPEGKHDGIRVYDFNVSTFVGRDQSSKVATILGILRQPDGKPWVPPGTRGPAKWWVDTLIKALAGEPEVTLETQWEWSCEGCGKEAKESGKPYPRAITGMNKFPVDQEASKKGGKVVYQCERKCEINPAHGYTRARVTVSRILPLGKG